MRGEDRKAFEAILRNVSVNRSRPGEPPLLMVGVLSGFLNAAFKRKRDGA